MARSIIAVLTGFVVIAALAVGADYAMLSIAPDRFTLTGRMDDPAVLLLVLAYVFAFAVFGCWLAARLAPDRPLQHAIVLGALGLAFNVVGTIARWDNAPVWYHVIALLLVMPAAWLGGVLRERQLQRQPAAPALG